MQRRLLFTFLLVTFISGCATMNESECVHANWRMVGLEDGSRGFSPHRIGNYRENCAKHGVTPDLADYQVGYQKGLESFCTEYIGFTKGRTGYQYKGQCPDNLEQKFLLGYQEGKEMYKINQEIYQIRSTLAQNSARMDNNENLINEKLAHLLDPEISYLERVTTLGDIKALQREQTDLAATKSGLTEELGYLEQQMSRLEIATKY